MIFIRLSEEHRKKYAWITVFLSSKTVFSVISLIHNLFSVTNVYWVPFADETSKWGCQPDFTKGKSVRNFLSDKIIGLDS